MEGSGWPDRVLAPMHWLERSRGWRRRGLASLYILIAATVGVLGWRAVSLWRLPDAPEPFDLAKYGRLAIPESRDAMVAYRAAFARFGEPDPPGQLDRRKWDGSDWATAAAEDRRWVEGRREALAAWLGAAELPDALLVQPEDYRISTLVGPVQAIRAYGRLGLMEGSRLQGIGDLDGAWRMYRAALRSSRHAGMHGGVIPRVIGSSLLKLCRPRVLGWVEDPRLTSDQLRRAIRDVEACAAMTSPASEMVRAEYFEARAALADPAEWGRYSDDGPESETRWYNHLPGVKRARSFLRREPERTSRVLRLVAAGYLAQADRPAPVRPRLRFPEFMIYDLDATTPSPTRWLAPEELRSWAESSAGAGLWGFSNQVQALVDAEPNVLDSFRIRMAERAYGLDHGRPPRTYGDLLGPYLGSLPTGVERDDSAGPGPG